MTSRNHQIILEYIENNQPITKAAIVKNILTVTPQTTYRIIKELENHKQIETNEHGLITLAGYIPNDISQIVNWPIIQNLKEFIPASTISIAYANRDEILLNKSLELIKKYASSLSLILTDLTILLQLSKQSPFLFSEYFPKDVPSTDYEALKATFDKYEKVLEAFNN
jgi:hypothetical protein